jgi:NADH-quinone oxidoreductase subunit H
MTTTLIGLLIITLKSAFVVIFGLGLGGLLTWADRRQGAMMQDRVGPNRAVVFVPSKLVAPGLVLPALAAGAGVVAYAMTRDAEGVERTRLAALFAHGAILSLWVTGLLIAGLVRRRGPVLSFDLAVARLGDPRLFFYGGLLAHLAVVVLGSALYGSELGLTLREVGFRSGPFLIAFSFLGGSGYLAAVLLKSPKVGIRLLGLLHPAADGLKTLFKEDFIPPGADRLMHSLAPFLGMFPALVVLAIVPFGPPLCVTTEGSSWIGIAPALSSGVCDGQSIALQVLDADIGVLYFFAMGGTGIVGAALAGWSSNNKFSLLGGLRAASQMVSYEVTLGLTLVGALMIYGTFRLDEMVRWQAENTWGVFVQPLAFLMFFAAAVAESKRIPFDLPEGESEIVAGYFTEYSGMKFAMFFFAEYVAVVSAAAMMAAIFFGGWHLPFVTSGGVRVALAETVYFELALPHGLLVLIGLLGFVGKVVLLSWLQLSIRWTLPRFRYDQLMKLSWRMLLPSSLANILVTGVLVLLVAGSSQQFRSGLAFVADLTELAVAACGGVATLMLVLFVLKPASHRRLDVTSAARFAATEGGTRAADMGA